MPQGLQVWNASGQLIVDVTDNLGRVLGIANVTGGAAGSVTHAGFAQGTGFWMLMGVNSYALPAPAFSLSGTTLSWTWPDGGSGSFKLVYGVY